MQENGKLFSFLVITHLFLMAFEPERDVIYRTTEKYIDTVVSSVITRESIDSVSDADVSHNFPHSTSSFKRAEML